MNPPNRPTATNIYRIVSFDRAAEIITKRQLYFAHPSAWDDPYERVISHELSKAIFAQCWCRKAISDAMWRIYSPHGLGVRIGTTKQRLERALDAAKSRGHIDEFLVQDVSYFYEDELQAKMRAVRAKLVEGCTFARASDALFKKRVAFDHERECRVIIFSGRWLNGDQTMGRFLEVDPFEVLTNIWLDPRAPEEVLNAFRFYLKDKLGFPGTVAKSKLYEFPTKLAEESET